LKEPVELVGEIEYVVLDLGSIEVLGIFILSTQVKLAVEGEGTSLLKRINENVLSIVLLVGLGEEGIEWLL